MYALANGLFAGRECPYFRQPRRTLGKTLGLRLARALIQMLYLSGKGPQREQTVGDRWKSIMQSALTGNTTFFSQGNINAEKLRVPLESAKDGICVIFTGTDIDDVRKAPCTLDATSRNA
jgi:hypothetical protein